MKDMKENFSIKWEELMDIWIDLIEELPEDEGERIDKEIDKLKDMLYNANILEL